MKPLVDNEASAKPLIELFDQLGSDSEISRWLDEQVTVIKSDSNSRVGFFNLGKNYYIKRYYYPSAYKRVLNRLVGSRLYRVWPYITDFSQSFPTPKPLLLLALNNGREVIYLTEYVDGASSLHDLFKANKISDRQSVMAKLGTMVAGFHQQAWVHSDLKWTNFLVDKTGDIFIIDLDGLKKSSILAPGDGSYRDLARFVLNAEDLVIGSEDFELFVAAYCQVRQLDSQQLKKRVKPYLEKLRQRHLKKYGPRGEQIF